MHPFYVLSKGWTNAENLNIGNQLLSKQGIVTLTQKSLIQQPQQVYNLEVRNWHNFVVGEKEVVVHNAYFTRIKNLKESICNFITQQNKKSIRDKIEELISEHDTNNEYDKANITALAGYALKKSVGGLNSIHTNALIKIGNKILNSNEKIDNVTDIFYDVIGGINFNDVSVIDVDFSNFGNKPDGTPNEIWEGNHNDSKDFTNAMKLLTDITQSKNFVIKK